MILMALGILAGVLTTLTGMGGGLFLVVVVGLLLGPKEALVLTSATLLVSNAHRAYLMRSDLDRSVAFAVASGALPGALVGALLLPSIPESVIAFLLAGSTAIAILRARGHLKMAPRRGALTSFGAVIGAMAATSGGAGLLVAPLVMSTGLRGAKYVATVAVCAVAMHIGRVVGYGSVGLFHAESLPLMGFLLTGLIVGNLFGRRLRGKLTPAIESKLEIGALALTSSLSVLGLLL